MNNLSWEPDHKQLSDLLKLIQSGGEVESEDMELRHLAYLLLHDPTVDHIARIRAGRLLNAQLSTVFARAASHLEADSISYIRLSLLHAIRSESSPELQRLYAQLVSTLLCEQNGLDMTEIWPGLFTLLLELLQRDSPSTAYTVLREIVGHGQTFSPSGISMLNQLLSLSLPHLRSSNLNSFAFQFLYDTTRDCSMIFTQRSEEILCAIEVSIKENADIDSNRLSMLMNRWWDRHTELMRPHMPLMIEAMIKYSASSPSSSASFASADSLAAAGKDCSHFAHEEECHWPALLLSVAQNPDLSAYLPQLVPLILQNLTCGGSNGDTSPPKVRKRFISALERLAMVYPETVFQLLFPLLEPRFSSTNWQERESAVLALGAIASGCSLHLIPQYPSLIPLLIAMISYRQPLLRCSVCWTLGGLGQLLQKNVVSEPLILRAAETIIFCSQDEDEKVKLSALAALQQLCVTLPDSSIEVFSGALVQYLCLSFETMEEDLLDRCIEELAFLSLRPRSSPAQAKAMVESMKKRLEALSENSKHLRLSLLECITSFLLSHAEDCLSWGPSLFAHYVLLLTQEEQDAGPSLATALELLGEMSAACPTHYIPRLGEGQLPQLLMRCTQNPSESVRTEAYYVVRVIVARDCTLAPLQSILSPLIQNLLQAMAESTPIAEQALRTFGKIAKCSAVDLRRSVPSLVTVLISILSDHSPIIASRDRCLYLLFYLAMNYASMLVDSLQQLLPLWCDAAAITFEITSHSRRAKTLRSICSMYEYCPSALERELARQRSLFGERNTFVLTMAEMLEERRDRLSGKSTV